MIYAIVAVIVLIIDQAVKWWIVRSIDYGASMDFIPKIMELTHHHNTGMAFGLGSNIPWARWAFVALTVVFCGAIIYMLAKRIINGKAGRWLIVLVMAGGIGNCIDRAINGYVVDMFHFTFRIFGWDARRFPVFNVADTFVSICGIAFCLWLIFNKPPEDEKALAGGPGRRKAEKERRKQKEARQKARERSAPEAHQDDYITQLKKPVGAARLELERERERARLAAEEEARAKAAKNQPRQQPQPRPRPAPRREPDLSDPFADFMDKTGPVPRETAVSPAARPESKPVASAPPAPPVRQKPGPAAAAASGAPKKSDTDFSLEDILAEFSDK